MNVNDVLIEQLESLELATKSKQIKWERNNTASSTSCEYHGRLLIVGKYHISESEEYFVLDGFDLHDQLKVIRVFKDQKAFSRVSQFYELIQRHTVVTSIER